MTGPAAARRDQEIPDRLERLRIAALSGDAAQVDVQRSLIGLWLLGRAEDAWVRTVRRSLLESLEAYLWRSRRAA